MPAQVERLLEQKAAAVAAENYDEAKRLKESIDRRPRPPTHPRPVLLAWRSKPYPTIFAISLASSTIQRCYRYGFPGYTCRHDQYAGCRSRPCAGCHGHAAWAFEAFEGHMRIWGGQAGGGGQQAGAAGGRQGGRHPPRGLRRRQGAQIPHRPHARRRGRRGWRPTAAPRRAPAARRQQRLEGRRRR